MRPTITHIIAAAVVAVGKARVFIDVIRIAAAGCRAGTMSAVKVIGATLAVAGPSAGEECKVGHPEIERDF
jgi:hypothetical protein